jgi:hypothetical protein
MVSRRAFVAPVMSLFALPLLGCPVHHEAATTVDAGVIDAAVAVLVPLDAGAPPLPPPANVNQVGRFPDESPLNDAVAKIEDPNVSARNAVPGGALVATLRIGTPVTQVAKHETFILCLFSDPKNPARNLEGWVAEQAFIPGPTIPSKSACPGGQTRLMVDEQDFCGRVCKSDGDCQVGLTCSGKASLFASGKTGAEVTTCTVPLPGASSTPPPLPPPAKIVSGVQIQPLGGNQCPPTFVIGPDKLCHRECSRGGCPLGSKCARALGLAICEAD